jgi:orotidine-5'-phosphate decarboxylase
MRLLSQTCESLCAVKLGLPLMLTLGLKEVSQILTHSKDLSLISIADVKLNDIENTNLAVADTLWRMGFDALIISPVSGHDGSHKALIEAAHSRGKGIISLCYMSHPGAKEVYGAALENRHERMYEKFMRYAAMWECDGAVVGATSVDIIRRCKRLYPNLDIYSPGVGVQGGSAKGAVTAGADYLIVGRSIVAASDPREASEQIRRSSWVG